MPRGSVINDTRILIIIQSRMESTRLPGKALLSLCGQPMLLYMLDRVSQVRGRYDLVVACPEGSANHDIQTLCINHGYICNLVEGNPNDVLSRFYAVAAMYAPDHIVRLTGDCPLIDPRTIEKMIHYHIESRCAYTGIGREWGDGNDMEIFTMAALTMAHEHAKLPSQREHVTPFIYTNPRLFSSTVFRCPLNAEWLRYSVDTADDLRCANYIANTLTGRYGWHYGWRDILYLAQTTDYLKKHMESRKEMNPAYIAQVQSETDQTTTWEEVRYAHTITSPYARFTQSHQV